MHEDKSLEAGVSVIICCYNSGWVIARCLDALRKQKVPDGLKWEILLVDNNCTDDTVGIAEESMRGCGIDFKIVRESKAGLVYARACGIMAARYKYAIYCDDDNLLCQEYVKVMYGILESNPGIGAAGGRGIAEFECEPDPVVLSKIEGYAIGSQIKHKNWLFGAGMALRTELAREVYKNQKLFLIGRKGGELLAGDDSELAYSIVLRGYKTYPTDDVSYVHVLRANRLTAEYCQKMYAGFDLTRAPLEVMQLVLEGGSFSSVLWRYCHLHLVFLKYKILFWHANAAWVCSNCRKELSYVKSWGLRRLWGIYREWIRIKQGL